MKQLTVFALLTLLMPMVAVADTKCEERTVSGHQAEMCMTNPGMFKHWTFTLKVDGELIFSLIDDYSEQISLTHTVPEGLALELPISRQGKKTASIVGGCVPMVDADDTEISRRCDFTWGDVKIIEAVQFIH